MENNVAENSKKIAFVRNGVISQILDTDPIIAELILEDCLKVDISDLENAQNATPDDLYDQATNTITLLEKQSYQG
jgi:hypothetical protein